MDEFIQDRPAATNRFRTDRALRQTLERILGPDAFEAASASLDEMGQRAVDELIELQEVAESNPPRLVSYDSWGQRIDRIDVDPAWNRLVRIGQEAGIVATAYEKAYGALSRVVQLGLLHLFMPVSATADCPLAMTDAAAATLLAVDPELAEVYVPRLTARQNAWTSGQWMTEREGGSDVGRTSTVAHQIGEVWELHGSKWFTSATTADMALVLARPEGASQGSRWLSLFALELRRPDGSWNGIRVRRLKDKLGTKALPTAELDLEGTIAVPVGGVGRGVAKISTMLNVTRLHAACGANALAGHGLGLARDYASRREAFGKPLTALPAHRNWIARIAATYEAGVVLIARAAELLGHTENGGDALLARVVMPLTKLAVARQGVDACSQLIESFGGAGYVEDTGLPRLLRDAHIQCIWEGTTTIMALDVVRALGKEGTGDAFLSDVEARARAFDHPLIAGPAGRVFAAIEELRLLIPQANEAGARRLAWGMARTYQAALLCEAGGWALQRDNDSRSATAASLFTSTPLVGEDPGIDDDRMAALAFE